MAVANIYDGSGAVVGYLTAGNDQTHITGVIDKNTYGGDLVGKSVIAPHVLGGYYAVVIDALTPATDPQKVIFTGHVFTVALANFVPKPFSTISSTLQNIANELMAPGTTPADKFPIWPLLAGAGAGVLLLALIRD